VQGFSWPASSFHRGAVFTLFHERFTSGGAGNAPTNGRSVYATVRETSGIRSPSGRRLHVVYTGRYPRPAYRCDTPNLQLGRKRCFGFGGKRIDDAVAGEMLRAVAPMAIEAAREAERMLKEKDQDRLRIAELELNQARYDASLAERRYAACDPDNRLIAAQLEKAWEATLQRVEACRQRLNDLQSPEVGPQLPDLTGLADDLAAAWNAPRTTMRTSPAKRSGVLRPRR
jgi:hypothetical protein